MEDLGKLISKREHHQEIVANALDPYLSCRTFTMHLHIHYFSASRLSGT